MFFFHVFLTLGSCKRRSTVSVWPSEIADFIAKFFSAVGSTLSSWRRSFTISVYPLKLANFIASFEDADGSTLLSSSSRRTISFFHLQLPVLLLHYLNQKDQLFCLAKAVSQLQNGCS